MTFEPPHDKTKLHVRPAKKMVAKDPRFLHADNEDSDQAGRMRRLLWVVAGRTATLLVLSCRGSFQEQTVKDHRILIITPSES